MAKNDSKVTDNPKLKEKVLSDGQLSLYLEYYLGYTKVYNEKTDKENVKVDRRKEFLNLYLFAKPRIPIERQQNKETLELAKKIRAEREQELKESVHGYRLKKDRVINFLDYFQAYNDSYTKKDIRMMQIALNRFKDFLKDSYPKLSRSIKPEQINKDMMLAFVEYLQSRSKGEGAKSIYQRFKKVIKYAIEHDVMTKSPCTGVICKADDQALKKDVLSLEEEQALMGTHYENENPEIRRAFVFCLYTGIRFCDVIELKYKNVDYSNRLLSFEQNKTKGHSAASSVIIPLNDGLISLIGSAPVDDKNNIMKDEAIFHLPSHTMCLKALRRWTKRAGITKHITWHCARHSFAVNILNNGANIKTVASLLGHSGLKHTEKYTRAVDELKQAAINSLPELDFNVVDRKKNSPKKNLLSEITEDYSNYTWYKGEKENPYQNDNKRPLAAFFWDYEREFHLSYLEAKNTEEKLSEAYKEWKDAFLNDHLPGKSPNPYGDCTDWAKAFETGIKIN